MRPNAFSVLIVLEAKKVTPIEKSSAREEVPARGAHPLGQALTAIGGKEPLQLGDISPGKRALDDQKCILHRIELFEHIFLEQRSQARWNTCARSSHGTFRHW